MTTKISMGKRYRSAFLPQASSIALSGVQIDVTLRWVVFADLDALVAEADDLAVSGSKEQHCQGSFHRRFLSRKWSQKVIEKSGEHCKDTSGGALEGLLKFEESCG